MNGSSADVCPICGQRFFFAAKVPEGHDTDGWITHRKREWVFFHFSDDVDV